MSGTLSSLKRHRLLPAISFLTVVLLLTGEVFSCCRINESISTNVQHFIQSLGMIRKPAPIASTPDDEDHHAHCHGHENQSDQHSENDLVQAASGYTQDGSCISELAITKKSMVASESPTWYVSAAVITFIEAPILVNTVSVTRPRPQNRSSPPVYLLTLRLLV